MWRRGPGNRTSNRRNDEYHRSRRASGCTRRTARRISVRAAPPRGHRVAQPSLRNAVTWRAARIQAPAAPPARLGRLGLIAGSIPQSPPRGPAARRPAGAGSCLHCHRQLVARRRLARCHRRCTPRPAPSATACSTTQTTSSGGPLGDRLGAECARIRGGVARSGSGAGGNARGTGGPARPDPASGIRSPDGARRASPAGEKGER